MYMNTYIKKESRSPAEKRHTNPCVYHSTINNSQSTITGATLRLLHAPDKVHQTYHITVTVCQHSKML